MYVAGRQACPCASPPPLPPSHLCMYVLLDPNIGGHTRAWPRTRSPLRDAGASVAGCVNEDARTRGTAWYLDRVSGTARMQRTHARKQEIRSARCWLHSPVRYGTERCGWPRIHVGGNACMHACYLSAVIRNELPAVRCPLKGFGARICLGGLMQERVWLFVCLLPFLLSCLAPCMPSSRALGQSLSQMSPSTLPYLPYLLPGRLPPLPD
ncbi:uncharacterized protein K452DRAFT_46720 [Aplosporella prunicola CBS 121167]|uniref:Uncharacterized protein n=1 Tax=Aplosporella prunicola CBS 121167 TaxID=1176127 RepID=A0A6A6BB03_9PEZI|nr:uncharacterized protein K452DRAFT_46720 [Aplosporella prunicola CBS 121167]KAF2140444.1 hypothetical protein K452DRAFT_46720 [Aplosporella prunicola CBS 121167]